MTQAALYYPHWGIGNPRFLFEALLYWDRLACIVPDREFRPRARLGGELQKGVDLLHESFVTGLAPTDEVKERVHRRLEGLLDTQPPEWCRADSLTPSRDAVIAMKKMHRETVLMLRERGWMLVRDGDEEFGLISGAASGLVLGAIAEEMASDTMPAVTDEPASFKATCNGLLRELQSQQGIEVSREGDCYLLEPTFRYETELGVVLARITKLGIVDEGIEPGMFERLHRLRLDSGFNEQRELFRARVDRYVAELRERSPGEHPAIHDHWAVELASDREGLQKELRAAGIEGLTEKEGWVATGLAAVAGAGSFAAFAAAGPAVLVIGLGLAGYGIVDRVRRRRKAVRDRHWTSWLAAASNNRGGML
jgi:hypothetical protein